MHGGRLIPVLLLLTTSSRGSSSITVLLDCVRLRRRRARDQTIDLRKAETQAVVSKDVKTLQALLNLFLTAGDIGEDGTPIPPLALDGTAGAKTKQAALAFQAAAHLVTDGIVGTLTWKKLIEQDF